MEAPKILLVEDNPDDVELTRNAFLKANVANEVVVAEDGEEALEYIFGSNGSDEEVYRHLPGVILLDLKLPVISGLEVLQRIRLDPRTSCIPVVILTSSREDDDVARSYESGANAYVRKPVNYAQFVEVAKTLGLFWLIINQPPPKRTSCI